MRRSPQRSCIGCRVVRDKRELVRVVHTPDGRFVLDTTGKIAGRGAYVCPSPACLALAVKRKGFDRAFRQAVPREAAAALENAIQEQLQVRGEKPGGTEQDGAESPRPETGPPTTGG
ncbi:MAG TPA: YlxR family protein [Armatimonadota bacterium]|nr:YlxR family protein [Armatimonadota bacterium]